MNGSERNNENCFSVVLPCYNESENIVDLVNEIAGVMSGNSEIIRTFEILVIDDCSTDETVAILRAEFSTGSSPLRILRHRNNYGQSAAICSGVVQAKHPWIITLDGDGQNDPADIPKLIASLLEFDGARLPMICGQRVKRQDSWLRKFSSKIANGVRSNLLRDATADTGCGLKLFSRDAFMRFPRFNHMHRFLPALAKRDGGHIVSVAVNHRPRRHGVSKYGLNNRLWVGIVDLFGVIWLQRRSFRGTELDEH
ncbi:MAG: glycosyltransferase family 2 protein [Pseudomonadota bacterium]